MNKVALIILAAVGGFVAGVLAAPKSGKETRQDLLDKSNEYKGKAQDSLKIIKKGASSIKDELKSSTEVVKDVVGETANSVKQNVR